MSDLKMFINGRRFFPKGGNWGFSEYNLRYGADEYDTAVRMDRETINLNMIRNWVGQTGDEEFYEACDKYGIVVWQDFWLANPPMVRIRTTMRCSLTMPGIMSA